MRIVAKYGQGMGMDRIGADALCNRLDARRDDLVALTQELVRIPAVVVQDMMDSAKVMGLCLMEMLTPQRQANA